MARRAEAAALYDERFCRMWELYLAASEAGFRHNGLVVFQIQLAHRIDALPITRRYIEQESRARPTGGHGGGAVGGGQGPAVRDMRKAGEFNGHRMTAGKVARIVTVMFLWAVCFPLITAGFAYAPHLTFAAMRAIVSGAALVVAGLALGRRWPRGGRVWLALTGVGLGATSLGYLGMFMGSEFVSPGIATVIANAQPLMAAALAGAFLRERLGWSGCLGLALGFGGIILIAAPQSLMPQAASYGLGIAYILLAALGVTVGNVLIRAIAGKTDALMAMGAQMLIGAVPLLGAALLLDDPSDIAFTPQFLAILVAISLFGSSLAYWLWSEILRTTELNRANAFTFLVPVFGLAMGAAFFGETLGWFEFAGITLTLGGIALTMFRGGAVTARA